jgi:hypothetical protein
MKELDLIEIMVNKGMGTKDEFYNLLNNINDFVTSDWEREKLIKAKDSFEIVENGLGYVYFLKNMKNSLVKIGYTSNLPQRLRKIITDYKSITGESPKFKLIGVIPCMKSIGFKVEKSMHKAFEEKRKHGEWFLIKGNEDFFYEIIGERAIINNVSVGEWQCLIKRDFQWVDKKIGVLDMFHILGVDCLLNRRIYKASNPEFSSAYKFLLKNGTDTKFVDKIIDEYINKDIILATDLLKSSR